MGQSRTDEQKQFSAFGNKAIALQLDEVAEHLEAQNANPFRVQAYRNAAETIRQLPVPAQHILEEHGIGGLLELPGIGHSLARAIEQRIRDSPASHAKVLAGTAFAQLPAMPLPSPAPPGW